MFHLKYQKQTYRTFLLIKETNKINKNSFSFKFKNKLDFFFFSILRKDCIELFLFLDVFSWYLSSGVFCVICSPDQRKGGGEGAAGYLKTRLDFRMDEDCNQILPYISDIVSFLVNKNSCCFFLYIKEKKKITNYMIYFFICLFFNVSINTVIYEIK